MIFFLGCNFVSGSFLYTKILRTEFFSLKNLDFSSPALLCLFVCSLYICSQHRYSQSIGLLTPLSLSSIFSEIT